MKEQKIKKIIYKINNSNIIPNAEKIANRLISLSDLTEEDSEISVDSLNNFYLFLESNTTLDYPMISLTPDNEIYSSWENKLFGKLFSIRFLPNGDRRIVLFLRNDKLIQIN